MGKTCEMEHKRKEEAVGQLYFGLAAALTRLQTKRCDYCFMLAEKVHRCSECLTKIYCSRECLLKDSEEKHSKFCVKGEEERKVKEDASGGQGVVHKTRGESQEEE